MQPQRWQPTRLPRPWDSPGKNTGVDCHFLLQCMKVENESEVAQSTLRLPLSGLKAFSGLQAPLFPASLPGLNFLRFFSAVTATPSAGSHLLPPCWAGALVLSPVLLANASAFRGLCDL